MRQKYVSWSQTYESGKGIKTEIEKIVRGGPIASIQQKIDEIRAAPDAVRRVYIVTSSLSKTEVGQTLRALSTGTKPKPHFVQLYWLLTGYYSHCADMGTVGFIICRP